MAHRIHTYKNRNTNQPQILTDTIKHRQAEVNTNTYTRKKERQNKKRNYYRANTHSNI